MPSRTSIHRAEHARYLLPKYFLLTSAIVFLHSAFVYGNTGSGAGAGSDRHFCGLGLTAYVGVVGLVEKVEPPVDWRLRDG